MVTFIMWARQLRRPSPTSWRISGSSPRAAAVLRRRPLGSGVQQRVTVAASRGMSCRSCIASLFRSRYRTSFSIVPTAPLLSSSSPLLRVCICMCKCVRTHTYTQLALRVWVLSCCAFGGSCCPYAADIAAAPTDRCPLQHPAAFDRRSDAYARQGRERKSGGRRGKGGGGRADGAMPLLTLARARRKSVS